MIGRTVAGCRAPPTTTETRSCFTGCAPPPTLITIDTCGSALGRTATSGSGTAAAPVGTAPAPVAVSPSIASTTKTSVPVRITLRSCRTRVRDDIVAVAPRTVVEAASTGYELERWLQRGGIDQIRREAGLRHL